MTTSNVPVTAGSGKNVATYSFTEDAVTKEAQRVVLSDSSGAELKGQKTSTNSLSVVPASDTAAFPVSQNTLPWTIDTPAANLDAKLGSLTETAPASDTASSGLNGRLQRIAQRLTTLLAVFPTTIDTNSGSKSASTLRVVLATDQPQLTNKLLVTPDANSAVNVAQINGVTPLMGNGTSGTGAQRVAIASDNTVLPGVGAGATGSAVPANASYGGAIAKTALPSAATDANLVGVMSDKFGRQVVLPGTIRDLVGTQTTTISASTSETTVVTAGGSGVFNDLELLVVSNTSGTAARVDFRDTTGGSVLFSLYVPAGDTRGFSVGMPIPQTTANTNWTAQSSASVTDLRVYAVYHKNK